jgi:hypothetical protein
MARASQVRPSSSAVVNGVWLPPDILETWWERVLAVVATALVVPDARRYRGRRRAGAAGSHMASYNRLCGTLRTALRH